MTDKAEPLVTYETDEKVGILTLNRPAKLNAINADMKDQIIDGFARADRDPAVTVIVLRAEGRSFGVGFDIGLTPDRDKQRDDPRRWDPALRRSLEMALTPWMVSKPVIGSVQGHVLGGSCELVMMTDLTIAADDAQFGEPEVRFSHIGPVMVLPWIIGWKRAREILFFGDLIDAKTAREYGMVNRVVPAAQLRQETLKYAKRLSLISPETLQWGKRAINHGAEIGGFRNALMAGVDSLVSLYSLRTEVGDEFDRLVHAKGLKAALAWRAEQFRQ